MEKRKIVKHYKMDVDYEKDKEDKTETTKRKEKRLYKKDI